MLNHGMVWDKIDEAGAVRNRRISVIPPSMLRFPGLYPGVFLSTPWPPSASDKVESTNLVVDYCRNIVAWRDSVMSGKSRIVPFLELRKVYEWRRASIRISFCGMGVEEHHGTDQNEHTLAGGQTAHVFSPPFFVFFSKVFFLYHWSFCILLAFFFF